MSYRSLSCKPPAGNKRSAGNRFSNLAAPVAAPESLRGAANAHEVFQARRLGDLILRRPAVLSVIGAAMAVRDAILARGLRRSETFGQLTSAWWGRYEASRGLRAALRQCFQAAGNHRLREADSIDLAWAEQFVKDALYGRGLYAERRPKRSRPRGRVWKES